MYLFFFSGLKPFSNCQIDGVSIEPTYFLARLGDISPNVGLPDLIMTMENNEGNDHDVIFNGSVNVSFFRRPMQTRLQPSFAFKQHLTS